MPAGSPPVESGRWHTFSYSYEREGELHHGSLVVPSEAPWRRVFAHLDRLGASFSPAPVAGIEEAVAAVACCWQYGSYAVVLAHGEAYGGLRRDPALSRFNDAEMRRMNIEFSAGLAEWLRQRHEDAALIRRRTRAALAHLPVGWAERVLSRYRGREESGERQVRWMRETAEARQVVAAEHQPEEWDSARGRRRPYVAPVPTEALRLRAISNRIVRSFYRNTKLLETLHAGGRPSAATMVPGYRRLYPDEIARVALPVTRSLRVELAAWDRTSGRAHMELASSSLLFPQDGGWSLTEETGVVYYLGIPGGKPPHDARLAALAAELPGLYAASSGDLGSRDPGTFITWS